MKFKLMLKKNNVGVFKKLDELVDNNFSMNNTVFENVTVYRYVTFI